MKKVIVTGATSFIGLHLINRFINEKWKVYAVIRRNSQKINLLPNNENIKFIQLDMNEYQHIDEVIKESCDAYVSLAWNGTRGESRSDAQIQEKNYQNSMQALEAVYRMGCKTIISAGSQAEYGPMSKCVSEETICNPNTEYGKWKLRYFMDAMELCMKNELSFKEPRFFSLYGEDDYENTMIQATLGNMLKNKQCRLTECVQLWDFLYIEDAIEGIYRLLNIKCDDGAYNFGSGKIRPLKEFILEMHKIVNSGSELIFGAISYPDTGLVNVCPDITKLQKQTGWNAKISFSEGIKKILEYKQKNNEV